ncbi:MAG TPA: type II toxin-antitoxin system VapC family toxin [Methylococcaceae bacterium]|nr:type II toxin-antitoxin system VapC family toxin [Methylococcaceae bacterium]
MVYLDTSALAKWYLNESRSEDFASWIQNEADVHIGSLTVVEMRCLLARRRRNCELSIDLEQQVYATLQDDIAQGFLTLHPVEDEHVVGALNLLALLANHPLRTLDAIHLGIARRVGAYRLATADAVMGDAAQALDLEVIRFNPV